MYWIFFYDVNNFVLYFVYFRNFFVFPGIKRVSFLDFSEEHIQAYYETLPEECRGPYIESTGQMF